MNDIQTFLSVSSVEILFLNYFILDTLSRKLCLSLSPSVSLSVSRLFLGVPAELVAELLNEVSQFSSGLRFLFQKLVAQTGDVLFYFLQFTCNTHTELELLGKNQILTPRK